MNGTLKTIAFAAGIAALSLPAPVGAQAQEGDLKVGVLVPYTGQYGWVGENVEPVARMIADEVNGSGGIGGRNVVLVQGDTEGVVDAGTTAAQKLIDIDKVMALLGPTSLSLSGSKNLIVDNGVPMVTPTAGTTALDRACQTVCFRTVPSDSLGGRAVARALTDPKYLGEGAEAWKTPVFMVAQSPAIISFLEPVTRGFKDYGVELAKVVEFAPGKPSYRSEVQEVLSANPDGIILIAAPEESARVMTNAAQAGYSGGWFVAQDQTNPEYIELVGAGLAEGMFGMEEIAASESADMNRAFEERYKEYSGQEVKIFGTNTYDAMNVIVLAMYSDFKDDGEITRASLAEHIRTVSNPGDGKVVVHNYADGKAALDEGKSIDYSGLVGPIDFDDWGNITAPFGIRKVKDGAWTDVGTVSAMALD